MRYAYTIVGLIAVATTIASLVTWQPWYVTALCAMLWAVCGYGHNTHTAKDDNP